MARPRPRPLGDLDPRRPADVGEGAVPVVAEEVVGLGREPSGRAVDRLAGLVAAVEDLLGVGLDVGDDDQVEVAVAVEVAESRRGRPSR